MLERVLNHWPLKLLSLALAYAIWFSVIDENRIVQDFTIPLDLRLEEGQVLASEVPTTALVRLAGTETGVRRADALGMAVVLDLTDTPPGEHEIPLTGTNLVGIPRELSVDFINPGRLKLTVAARARKSLPIEPTLLGKPADGYALYSAEVFPERLEVEGPAEDLESMEVLRTSAIQLEGHREPFTKNVVTVPDSEFVRVVGRQEIQVQVIVDATPVERRFENVPVILSGPARDLQFSPRTVSVTLAAPPDLLDTLAPELLRAVADVSRLDPARREQQVSITVDFLQVPLEDLARVSVVSYSTREVTVRRPEARPR